MIDSQQLAYLAQEISCSIENGIKSAAPSLRDHFAGLAMQGLLASPYVEGCTPYCSMPVDVIAREAYAQADAMMAAREKATVAA